jgi:hypothetical protein
MEKRESLRDALIQNADLFEDGTQYTLERRKPELKLVFSSEDELFDSAQNSVHS